MQHLCLARKDHPLGEAIGQPPGRRRTGFLRNLKFLPLNRCAQREWGALQELGVEVL